ncbi:MAG: beta-galactosidase, partial [bacterium]
MRSSGLILTTLCILTSSTLAGEIDLTSHWDKTTPLENPYTGWYHHFPDNHINKYKIERDKDVLDIPGMDHIYIRLAWAYLEPREGHYNWAIIDDIIDHWTARGLGVSFRISCKETSTDRIEQQYATPRWVKQAGAKGGYYRSGEEVGRDGPWEPSFDDPLFLEKLDNFLAVFATRYDGQSWLRYVDVGSIGDWGEGHTHSGSRKTYGFDVRKKHIDLYTKHFTQTQVVVTDDFVYSIPDDAERNKMRHYVDRKGLTYRDDSILVDWYVKTYAED